MMHTTKSKPQHTVCVGLYFVIPNTFYFICTPQHFKSLKKNTILEHPSRVRVPMRDGIHTTGMCSTSVNIAMGSTATNVISAMLRARTQDCVCVLVAN